MRDNPVFATSQAVFRLCGTLLFDLKVQGIRNIPLTGGVLIVANHQSYLDPPLIGSQIPRATSYLGKSELFDSPFRNWLYRRMGAFPVRQGEGDISAVREAINRLKEGKALVLFPEGSRSEDGELQPVQPGVGLIARRAGVPVVPCVIDGSFAALPRRAKALKTRPVRVRFGEPMKVDHLKSGEVVKAIEQAFRVMLMDLRRDFPETGRRVS